MWIRDSRKSGFNVTTQLSESRRLLTSGTGEPIGIEETSDTTMLVTHFTLTVSAVICFKVLFVSHFIYTASVQAYSILWRQLLSWAFLSPPFSLSSLWSFSSYPWTRGRDLFQLIHCAALWRSSIFSFSPVARLYRDCVHVSRNTLCVLRQIFGHKQTWRLRLAVAFACPVAYHYAW